MRFLYIDPGTGSMLFTVLLGVFGASIYAVRSLFLKLRVRSAGKSKDKDKQKAPLTIFSDDKRYWNVFKPVCEVLNSRGQEVSYLTSSPDDPALKADLPHIHAEFIGEDNQAFGVLNSLHTDILFSTTPGLDVYQWKRSKHVKWYVHTLHAAGNVAGYRMFGIDYYDALLLSGKFQEQQLRELEEQRHLPAKEVAYVGIPYLDVMRERLLKAGPLENHEFTVLLAPSWGESGILSRYGEKMIRALLATGYHIVIRPHPQSFKSEAKMMEKMMEEFPASDQLEWNRDNDNFEVLRRSDIMISDFSGVVYDFTLVFDKPVIYTAAKLDKAPYDSYWLKDEIWTLSTLPKLGKPLTEEMLDSLKETIDSMHDNPAYQQARDTARSEVWMYPGEGAERTADYLINKLHELEADS